MAARTQTAPTARQLRSIDLDGVEQSITDLPTVKQDTEVIFLPYLRVSLSRQRLKLFDSLQLVMVSTDAKSKDKGKAYLLLRCRQGKHGYVTDVWNSAYAPEAEVRNQHARLSEFLEQAIKEVGGSYSAPL
jgi:hypothetical protein